MPARNAPPVAAVVVGLLVAAAIILVVSNRVVNPRPRPGDPAAGVARLSSADDPVGQAIVLEQAGRHRDAADVLRKYLDERPDDLDAFVVLQRVLPADDKSELGDRLAKCTQPEDAFDALRRVALDNGHDAATIAALYAGLKKARPNDHRWACDEIKAKIRAERYAEATAQFRDRVAVAATDGGRAQLLIAFVEGMCGRDRHLDAYAAVPDAHAAFAFRAAALSLEPLLLAGPPPDGARRALRGLIDAHRVRAPADPRLWYDEGVLLQAAREYERAEKVYADGESKLPPRSVNDTPGPLDLSSWDDGSYRGGRVECLYKAGRAMKAYADVGPPDATFLQLALAFAGDKNPDGLAELLAAHRARFPSDKQIGYWEAEVLFLRGEYAKAAAGFEVYRTGVGIWPESADRIVRSHLRAGNAAAAHQVTDARTVSGHPVAKPLQAAVRAAHGEVELVDAMLAESLPRGGVAAFYADEDFAREFAAPTFAELRAKYPDPRGKR